MPPVMVSNWTKSKTAQLEESSASKEIQAPTHRVGLISMTGEIALLLVLNAQQLRSHPPRRNFRLRPTELDSYR